MSHSTLGHYRVLILGGGAGGVSVAARLAKRSEFKSIAIVEPSSEHYYQPLWTLVGAGLVKAENTVKKEQDVIPRGVDWIKETVKEVRPTAGRVALGNGQEISYDFLVVATGLRLAFEKIKGLEGNLGRAGLCSVYQFRDAKRTAEMIEGFKGGRAIFTMPPVPIKCAGAPQKVMYLADDVFRQRGVRAGSEILFATAGKAMFGIPTFSNVLDRVVARREIKPLFQHKLVEVRPEKKTAVFEVAGDQGATLTETPYDLLHVVPPMEAHAYVQESGLAFTEGDQKGWLKVDKFTLQHADHPNIFGIGDVTGVPNSKTGAAVRKQVPVVVQNLVDVVGGRPPSARYDGYSSCPLITGVGRVMLAEFGYDGKLMPTFPFDPAVERRSMWYLKKDVLPVLYWHGMLKGLA